ncbi:Glycosyltransferase involved in cell wall bisynthesis [Flavobacteriaceae bacterium MAR_2010_188]|nr:Glycosyltransferase involved in cell wall bisynthesis [Flavobacteriaceae bacterium MAR_2010_188]
MNYPLISICIPTYNGARYISEAMDSAINQNFPNLEIIVSDDASTDSTLEIVEDFKNKSKIPIYIFHHKPNGIGANWNNCIKKANGEYIKFLFQDDILESECVKEMFRIYYLNNIDLLCCKREFKVERSFISNDSESWINTYRNLQETLDLEWKDDLAIIDKSIFKSSKLLSSPINKFGEPSVMFFKKSLIDRIGYFKEDLNQVLDYELCYRILIQGNIGISKKELVKFRLHSQQATVKNKSNEIYVRDHEILRKLLYSEYLELLNPELKKQLRRSYNPLVSAGYDFIDFLKHTKNYKF